MVGVGQLHRRIEFLPVGTLFALFLLTDNANKVAINKYKQINKNLEPGTEYQASLEAWWNQMLTIR